MFRHRFASWIPIGLAVVGLLAVWKLHGYHLPLPARAGALNQGRTWEFKSRLDAKGVEQVWVPPGCFEMGSSLLDDLSARADETPRHTVCISTGFWMDRYEVTQESFMQFVREGGFDNRRYWSVHGWQIHQGRPNPHPGIDAFNGPRQPRVKITWYEAEAYAAWRGGKIPTEAQWEWAARGPNSRRYPWGNEFVDGVANMDGLNLRCTRPVGSYPAGRSWCGVEDMAGNIWEWVADGYDRAAYRTAVLIDPYTPPNGMLRIMKGGAWGGMPGGSASDIRCARRVGWPAGDRKNSHGARIITEP